MAYAVATLGPDLTVRRARKVRKGLQGLTGKDRYEVVAIPAPQAAAPADAVNSAFEALLNQAEEVEAARAPAPVRRTTRPATPLAAAAVLEAVPDAVPAVLVEPELLAVHAPPQPPTAPRRKAPAPKARPAVRRAPAPKAVRVPRTAPVVVPGQGWSRSALAGAGLPKAVLAALPARDPRGDLGWITALTKALGTVLPPAATLDAAHPVTVSGHGLAGALGILAAAARGLTPGTITYGERTAPATATELALAVRAEVIL